MSDNYLIPMPSRVPGTEVIRWAQKTPAADAQCGCPSTVLLYDDGTPLASGLHPWTNHSVGCPADTNDNAAADTLRLHNQVEPSHLATIETNPNVRMGFAYAYGVCNNHMFLSGDGRTVLEKARAVLRHTVDDELAAVAPRKIASRR